ncbi:RluA family pseudouridine synthase [Mesoplasma syrphidae]|uniref:Pseudouridine synthase n=1 Tax=Mesoplasma syrphidae TaxID=225999 RepID=A0A2K9BUT7_9MOLU|nr:RluA family pseudouridine synthase [Mesoplasma syrphidae]AUF83480.1 RluA family pseudouridine synthase [Mesoplasma syrphidae]
MEKQIKIIAKAKSNRLDKYLAEALKEEHDLSRAFIQKLIKDQNIQINGIFAESQKVNIAENDVITITIPAPKSTEVIAEKIDFEIIYQDQDILVINKPNNIVVHPGAGNTSGTLVNGLLEAIDDLSSIGGVERPGIVHRLDRQTTGLLIVAKNDKAHKVMSQMLVDHEVYKEYQALVWGVISENKGIIDAPIGRHQNDRKKMMVTNKNAKHAKTNFEVIERFDNASLVRCSIETGRTHQIRVHFNFIKHPIMGDPMYGRLTDKDTNWGQYLHAYKLVFNHPITNERMEFIADLPKEFSDKIKELKGEA